MKYFTKKMTLDEVKAAYRAAAMKLHPDRGGSTAAMQELNNEFGIAFAIAQKFEKAEPAYSKRQPKTAESASSYRRQFYTMNGWQGERYNRNLSTKDIAKLIREYVKNAYPTYRFSITSNIRHITVSLIEHPVALTNRELLLNYYYTSVYSRPVYIPSKGCINANDTNESDREEWINYQIETAGCKKNFLQSDTRLNPVVFAVLQDVQDLRMNFFRLGGEITDDVIDWHFLSEAELQMDIFFKPLEKHDIEKIR